MSSLPTFSLESFFTRKTLPLNSNSFIVRGVISSFFNIVAFSHPFLHHESTSDCSRRNKFFLMTNFNFSFSSPFYHIPSAVSTLTFPLLFPTAFPWKRIEKSPKSQENTAFSPTASSPSTLYNSRKIRKWEGNRETG